MTDAPGSGAASVAAQLVAFFREPARFRPHYIHGDEPLPEGHVVLKFALGRFSRGWHRDLSHHDQQELSDAARAFVRQVCLWERATPYQVLCLARDAGRDAVKENYRLLMALLHPDRPDALVHAWPEDCAQRVNDAYAILSDDALRSAYDEGIRKAQYAGAFEHPATSSPISGRGPRHGGWARSFVVVSAVVAALFVVQSWWVSDQPEHYALLEHAFPLRASAKWVRDALPNAELPRFMDFKPVATFDPIEFLTPSKQPHRLASLSVWTPLAASSDPPAREPMQAAEVAASLPGPALVPVPSPPPREAAPPALRLAQAVAPPPTASPSAPRVSTVPAPTPEHVEMLVARLVSYYEAGDSQGLVGLFDPEQIGFWKGFQTRATYSDFFRATRERRLRMDRLKWQAGPQVAQARGDATIIAEYSDGTGKVERKVPVEIDITLRDGQARITRLVLFPGGN